MRYLLILIALTVTIGCAKVYYRKVKVVKQTCTATQDTTGTVTVNCPDGSVLRVPPLTLTETVTVYVTSPPQECEHEFEEHEHEEHHDNGNHYGQDEEHHNHGHHNHNNGGNHEQD